MSSYEAERADVVVVGGGVIGLSIACELLKRADSRFGRVVVLERGQVGRGATWACAGMISPKSEADVQTKDVIELGHDSARRYPDFIGWLEGLSASETGYRRDGTLWVAADADEMRELEHLQALQRDKGVSSQALSRQEVLAREPALSPRVAGGLHVDIDHHIDPRRLTRALRAALEKLSGRLLEGHEVRGLSRGDDGWTVSGQREAGGTFSFRARQVVLAAGVWSEHAIESPLPRLGLRPIKGQALRLGQPKDAPLVRHVIRSPRVYLVPGDGGALVVGATSEEQGFWDAPTAGATMDLLRYAWRILPGIYDLGLQELSVGFRPCLRDHQPAIGSVDVAGCEELYLALGHYREGVLLAPATAYYLVEQMLTGKAPDPIAAFDPRRLLGRPDAERAQERAL